MYQKQKLGKVITSILDKYDFTKWIESAQEKKSWDDWLSEVVNYKNEFSKWPSSKINKNDPAYNIGAWLNLNKQKYRAGELQQDRAAKMKEAGIILEKIQDKIWDKHLEEIKRWFDEKGDWPKAQSQVGKCYEGKLGNWITSQKNWYWGNTANKSEYPDRRKKKLESIGINFVRTRQLSKSSWEIQFDHLEEYTKLNPNKWPKRDEQFPKGNNLGSWCNSQKQNYRKGKLQKFRQDMLESIGFDIVTSDENRIKGLQRWCERSWYATYNQIKFLSDSGIKITSTSTLHQKEYKWLIKQKLRHKSGELDQEKINFLKALSLL